MEIALSLAIDYWDYLGWKDTLALAGHSSRQKAYSHVRGDRDVYTPQAVINGSLQALGGDRGAIEHAIAQSRHEPGTLSLPVHMSVVNGRLTVTAPAASGDAADAEVWLCPLMKSVAVSIGRGENGGHTYTYLQRGAALGEARRVARQGRELEHSGRRHQDRRGRRRRRPDPGRRHRGAVADRSARR